MLHSSLFTPTFPLPPPAPAPASPEPPKPLRCLQFTRTDHVTPSSDAHHACSLLGCFSSLVSQPGNGDSLFSVKPLVTHRCLFHYSCFSSWSVTFPINSPQGRRPCVNHLHVGVGAGSLEACPGLPTADPWAACNRSFLPFGGGKVTLWTQFGGISQVCPPL